jgi:hypothetical protein
LFKSCGFGFEANERLGFITVCDWIFTEEDLKKFCSKDIPKPTEHMRMCQSVEECATGRVIIVSKDKQNFTSGLAIQIHWSEYEHIYALIQNIQKFCFDYKFGYCLKAFGSTSDSTYRLPLRDAGVYIDGRLTWEAQLVKYLTHRMWHSPQPSVDVSDREIFRDWKCGLLCLRSWQTPEGRNFCKSMCAKYNVPLGFDINDDDFDENGVQLNPFKTPLFAHCNMSTLKTDFGAAGQSVDDSGDTLCYACLEQKQQILLSCGHHFYCEKCFLAPNNDLAKEFKCPECMQVYKWYINFAKQAIPEIKYVSNNVD